MFGARDGDGFTFSKVRRWTKPRRLLEQGQVSERVLDCDRIIIPVHRPVHWICIIVCVREQEIICYDPLPVRDIPAPNHTQSSMRTCLTVLERP